jgi:hypothetical protein
MKHIQHNEQTTFQKFAKKSKRDESFVEYKKKGTKRISYNKQQDFKRNMRSVE